MDHLDHLQRHRLVVSRALTLLYVTTLRPRLSVSTDLTALGPHASGVTQHLSCPALGPHASGVTRHLSCCDRHCPPPSVLLVTCVPAPSLSQMCLRIHMLILTVYIPVSLELG